MHVIFCLLILITIGTKGSENRVFHHLQIKSQNSPRFFSHDDFGRIRRVRDIHSLQNETSSEYSKYSEYPNLRYKKSQHPDQYSRISNLKLEPYFSTRNSFSKRLLSPSEILQKERNIRIKRSTKHKHKKLKNKKNKHKGKKMPKLNLKKHRKSIDNSENQYLKNLDRKKKDCSLEVNKRNPKKKWAKNKKKKKKRMWNSSYADKENSFLVQNSSNLQNESQSLFSENTTTSTVTKENERERLMPFHLRHPSRSQNINESGKNTKSHIKSNSSNKFDHKPDSVFNKTILVSQKGKNEHLQNGDKESEKSQKIKEEEILNTTDATSIKNKDANLILPGNNHRNNYHGNFVDIKTSDQNKPVKFVCKPTPENYTSEEDRNTKTKIMYQCYFESEDDKESLSSPPLPSASFVEDITDQITETIHNIIGNEKLEDEELKTAIYEKHLEQSTEIYNNGSLDSLMMIEATGIKARVIEKTFSKDKKNRSKIVTPKKIENHQSIK